MYTNAQHKTDDRKSLHNDFPAENEPKLHKRIRLLESVAREVSQEDDDGEMQTGINAILQQQQCGQPTCCQEGLQAIADTIRHTMLEINEIRERNQERRHQQLMQFLANCLKRDMNATESAEELNGTTNACPTQGDTTCTLPVEVRTESQAERAHNSDTQAAVVLLRLTGNDVANTQEHASTNLLDLSAAHCTTGADVVKLAPTANYVLMRQKRELQAMRVQMLEIQRQKMADRERKKWGNIQVQST